jgi:outer membrane protein OmpA-like peptidoglycan-associated protein
MRSLLAACTALVLMSGCAASLPSVRGHHDTLRERIHRAKSLGAMECGPVALADAQAHYRFAAMELSQGNVDRASQHVEAGLGRVDLAIASGVSCQQTGVTVKDLLADPWPDADGDGVKVNDRCPWVLEDRDGFEDHDGCPEPDNDGDGIADREDQCPNEPEDIDGFADEDGCIERDNDADGILDADDACRNVPETVNGFADEDGCPDFRPEHIDIFEDRIAFRKPLVFVDNSALLLGMSHPALRELAQVLKDNGDVAVRVEGHTDNRGEPDALVALSEGRARAVYDFLLQQGVEASRMEFAGLGDSEPVSTNRTAAGRKANQRVDIEITAGRVVTVGGG